MNAPQTMKIDDVEYVRKDSVPVTEGDIKIVILDRGFVYVGQVQMTDYGLILHNASNIRQWGTTKGLGELVNGPLANTKLDKVGTVRVPAHAVISMIDVEQSKWNLF